MPSKLLFLWKLCFAVWRYFLRFMRRSLEMRFLKRLPTAFVLIAALIISYLAWNIFIQWLPLWMPALELPEMKIKTVADFAAVATLAFGIGAGIMVLIELTETADSRNIEIYQDIYDKFMSEKAITARRCIYNLESKDAKTMYNTLIADPEAQNNYKYTLNLFDYFGFLADQDWVTSDELVGWVSPIVVKTWAKIGPVVEYECSLRPEEPDYYESARRLAKMCQRWRNWNYPGRQKQIEFDSSKRL